MDKKPHYRQSAIVFCSLGIVFMIIGLSVVLRNDRLILLEIPLVLLIMVYAIVSSVRISRNSKKEQPGN